MAEEEPYEIMPYKDITELRKQVQELKSKGSDAGSKQLLDSISKLTEQMTSMMGLFKTAAEEMHLEEKDEHFVAKKIEPLIDKLDEIIEQNKTIAEGMVAVADMIKESMEKTKEPRPFLSPQPEPAQSFEPLQGMAGFEDLEPKTEMPKFWGLEPKMGKGQMLSPGMPRHTPPRPMPSMSMPAQTPPSEFGLLSFEGPKKRGLFNRFKK